ncbi:shikimate dehydrogenase, partial [Hortaea werneckii]
LLDEIDGPAKVIGALNTVVPFEGPDGKTVLRGYNTDWQGMVLALRNAGAHGSAAKQEAGMVVGGGGTARAALYALKEMGYSPIYLVGRNKEKLAALTSAFSEDYNIHLLSTEEEASAIPADKQPVVAIGTIPGDSPIDPAMREILISILSVGTTSTAHVAGIAATNSNKVLLEMAYKPAVTSLMQLAQNSGWRTVPGLEALVGQGIHQFRLWTDIVPLYEVSRDAVMGKEKEA